MILYQSKIYESEKVMADWFGLGGDRAKVLVLEKDVLELRRRKTFELAARFEAEGRLLVERMGSGSETRLEFRDVQTGKLLMVVVPEDRL